MASVRSFAVLPEGWRQPFRDDSTHEKIKQPIDVPSQCIQHDHTLPEAWVNRPHRDIVQEDQRLARRIQQRYELCLWNLLVKHHWIPFAPLDPFAYGVHIGLDVGGRHNNRAMACLGYGFGSPRDGLLFRAEEIAIDVQKAEPIPTQCLTRGLMQLFEHVHADLTETGMKPDFERVLFFRDGRLLGDGDEWNERDALRDVYARLRQKGWVSEHAVWTAVEVMKHAEEWRLMSGANGVSNPLVGRCVFPFDDDATGLICTTGVPYLPQGTAAPLKIHHHRRAWPRRPPRGDPGLGVGSRHVLHEARHGDEPALGAARRRRRGLAGGPLVPDQRHHRVRSARWRRMVSRCHSS